MQASAAEFVALEKKNLLSTDEASALANANRVLRILAVSSADHLSEIVNSEMKVLCDALDNRRARTAVERALTLSTKPKLTKQPRENVSA